MIQAVKDSLKFISHAYSNEKELQDVISDAFTSNNIPHQREVESGRGFIDFVVFENVIVEIKIKGSALQVTRQVIRYLEDDRFRSAIIITTKPMILPMSEIKINGEIKKIESIDLWRQFM